MSPAAPPLLPVRFGLLAAAVAAWWLLLGARLANVWSHAPDLAHGWAVPALLAYLLWARWTDRPPLAPAAAGRGTWLALAALLPLLAAVRLLLGPYPSWPVMLFALTAGVLVFTVLAGRMLGGGRWIAHFLFPLLFILTALPLPGTVDRGVILPLREFLARVAAELVSAGGFPALAHGTVIEVGRGFVGVDEACSGIRSLQTVMMVALFLGELHRLSPVRRAGLFLGGLALALAFNLGRTLFLTWQAARHGLGAVERWHDPAGHTALVATLGALCLLALHQSKRPRPLPPEHLEPLPPPATTHPAAWAAALLAGALLLESGAQWWFRGGLQATAPRAAWQVALPERLPTYVAHRFTPNEEATLFSTDLRGGQLTGDDGAPRAAYRIGWQTGQSARFVPFNHNPAVCFPSAGCELVADFGPVAVPLGRFALPFRSYLFRRGGERFHVFYLVWDNDANQPLRAEDPTQGSLSWLRQAWDEVRLRRLNLNAQMFIYAVYGDAESAEVLAAFPSEIAALLAPR
ncbi:MAG: exosortase/archaeosortase family protein [Opitutae bacterium]|nr:exosortase/archaeosortase family protein [Opitutae bacterium]